MVGCGQLTDYPMKLTVVPTRSTSNFTQVPNEVLNSAALTDHQKIFWISWRSVCNGTQDTDFYSITELANRLEAPVRNVQRDIKALIELGYIVKRGHQLHLEVDASEPENGEVKPRVHKEPKLSPVRGCVRS